jgi:S-adenosylmethionine hydrolase
MPEPRRVITLITDFGEKGPFAGAMKGAILSINPDAQVVDITHTVASGDILEAGFILSCVYRFYPAGTIHVVVVDPKVGSERRALLVSIENHYFLAPDNGVLSYIFAREEVYSVFNLTEDHFFLKPTSHTFHGRDIFAPVAAWLSKYVESSRFGEPIEDYLRLDIPQPANVRDKAWKGTVLYVDNFGNLITNFTPEQIPLDDNGYPAVVKVLHTRGEIAKVRRYFAEFPEREPFLLLGSSGYYEIAINNGSAAQELGLKAGSDLGVLLR